MLTKYASFEVLDSRLARQGAGLVKDAHRHEFDYDPRPGFLYVRSRAISSRTNDNFDHFPAEEIKQAYRTFIGKPVFVNHHNDNHRRARGVIVDAALHEDVNPDGTEDTWTEVLMEVDAVRFPKLAQAILAGEIDRTSMGTDVAFSVCSVCNNKASTPLEYCQHIPRLKGQKVRKKTASGSVEDVLVYERCYGLKFFENSLLVEEPADPTAFFLGVDDRGLQQTASRRTAIGETMAPAQVDTLRDESCPVCGEADSYDGDKCSVCGFVKPPDEFLDPDLEKAQQVDLRQEEDAEDPTDPALEDGEADPEQEEAEGQPEGADKPWLMKELPKDSDADSDEDEDEDDEESSKPWKSRTRRKSARATTQKEQSMRPALKALAEQQKVIDHQKKRIAALEQGFALIAEAAGISENPRVAALLKAAAEENPAQGFGWANPENGTPGTEAPSHTTEETLGDLETDSPEEQGEASESDVQPDATTSLDSTETVLDEALDLNEKDPTKPVAGTDDLGQGSRGNAGTNRTETEVRVGDPNSPDTAFSETGWTTSKKQSEGRYIASLRLARLRMQAGIEAEDGDDLALGTAIAQSDVADESIQNEIDTLAKVVQASGRARQPVARNLVPRAASQVQRTVPSFSQEPQQPIQTVASGPSDDEFAFE